MASIAQAAGVPVPNPSQPGILSRMLGFDGGAPEASPAPGFVEIFRRKSALESREELEKLMAEYESSDQEAELINRLRGYTADGANLKRRRR